MSGDDGKCADYAIAFTCGVTPELAGWYLWKNGRSVSDGATDAQIAKTVRGFGRTMRRVQSESRTIRTFVAEKRAGRYLITTADHVVALVDGRLCDLPEYGDLMRIEKIHRIYLKDPDLGV